MKRFTTIFLVFVGVLLVHYTLAVPVSVVENELSNTLEEEEEDEDDDPVIEDDFTTHGLERLSSAATCLVAGVEYTHGQQIYRADPCEFCLCLDGEMFCWWQDCPPTMEGPCRDRSPFSPCISIPTNPKSTSSFTSSVSDTTTKRNTLFFTNKVTAKAITSDNSTSANSTKTVKSTKIQIVSKEMPPDIASVTEILEESTSSTEQIELSSESPEISTAWEPKHCTIMGKDYQIGDKLPHDTGNCLECICGPGAKVTCSPHQCAPAGDEINDYRMSGQRQPTQDIF